MPREKTGNVRAGFFDLFDKLLYTARRESMSNRIKWVNSKLCFDICDFIDADYDEYKAWLLSRR